MTMVAGTPGKGRSVDENGIACDNDQMNASDDPWSLPYWEKQLSEGNLPTLVDPSAFHDPEKVNLALEACFEARNWEAASGIAQGWLPRLNVNRTSNNSPWIRRELLYFLRGKTEIKWVELLIRGQACMRWEGAGSALYEALNEVKTQLRWKETEGLPRLFQVVPKLLDSGATPSDGPEPMDPMLSSMRDRIAQLGPEHLKGWDEMCLGLVRSAGLVARRAEVEHRLEDAITHADLSAIPELVAAFLAIPKPYRLLCPLGEALGRHENRSDYPVVAVVAAMLEGGLGAGEACTWGEAPLSLVADHRCPPDVARDLMEVLLRAGANPDHAAEQPWCSDTLVVAMDRPLHACAYRVQPPVDILVAHGANVDVRDNRGMTPLLYAARECNLEAMQALLQAGADVHASSEETRGVVFEYLENMMRPEKDFDINPEQMVQGCILLASHGLDLDVAHEGKLAWASVFSCLENLVPSPRNTRLAKEFVQGLLDSGHPFNWPVIHQAAIEHECARPALSILSGLLLDQSTAPSLRPSMARRM